MYPVLVPAINLYQNDRRTLTAQEWYSADTWMLEALESNRIHDQPFRRHGYPTDDIVDMNEVMRRIYYATPFEKSTMSWVAPFEDDDQSLLRSEFHDQGMWERLFRNEEMPRGRLLVMGKGYQSAFSQSFPIPLPRTYIVLRGEVRSYIHACTFTFMCRLTCCRCRCIHTCCLQHADYTAVNSRRFRDVFASSLPAITL
jgi:hypothetical protein